ncbi:MAG: 2-oxo-4-hydroxy-4-carboxy-5-ureidoimidazoline decarboxylase [Candidatus Acidiferrales bacterium]|jgi:OHCU decarboxylase
MTPSLERWNALPPAEAEREVIACCGSQRWAAEISARRPFTHVAWLSETADDIWWTLDAADWLEAFAAHPKIGERAASGPETSQRWSAQEQSAADAANEDIGARLAEANRAYLAKFAFIFIVDASGKSRADILALLERRLQNDSQQELHEAAEQQRRIMHRRIEKLFAGDDGGTETK